MKEERHEKPKEQGREGKPDWNIRPYLAVALTFFLLFCMCLTVFFIFLRYQEFRTNIGMVVDVLQPIIMGLVIAYLIHPIMNLYEAGLYKITGIQRKRGEAKKWIRTVATLGALITFLFVIYLLFAMMVPQLIESINGLFISLPDQINQFVDWAGKMLKSDDRMISGVKEILMNGTDSLEKVFETKILPQAQSYVASITSGITTGIISIFQILFNFVVGLIVSIYVLMEKETFIGQAKKVVYAVCRPHIGNVVLEVVRKSHQILGGFLSGKIVDSAIIGVLCYGGLLFLNMPYTLLVSVIVGVTNVIPFFGPYIGAIPSVVLIALADPIKGLYFLVFIIILQQIDGNIIGPKILGNSTGLSSFWVVFAIMFGGGMFGVMGMIFGVPIFGIIYYMIGRFIRFCLHRRNLPEDVDDYICAESVDEEQCVLRVFPEEEKKEKRSRKKKTEAPKEEENEEKQ